MRKHLVRFVSRCNLLHEQLHRHASRRTGRRGRTAASRQQLACAYYNVRQVCLTLFRCKALLPRSGSAPGARHVKRGAAARLLSSRAARGSQRGLQQYNVKQKQGQVPISNLLRPEPFARAAHGHQRCLKLFSCFAAARAACVSTWLGEISN